MSRHDDVREIIEENLRPRPFPRGVRRSEREVSPGSGLEFTLQYVQWNNPRDAAVEDEEIGGDKHRRYYLIAESLTRVVHTTRSVLISMGAARHDISSVNLLTSIGTVCLHARRNDKLFDQFDSADPSRFNSSPRELRDDMM